MADTPNIADTPTPQNFSIVYVPLAVYNSNQNSDFLKNFNGRGIQLITNVTVVPGVDTITISILGLEPAQGDPYVLAETPAIVAVGTYILTLYPSITEVANEKVSQIFPETYAIASTHSNPFVTDFTYSIAGYIAI